MNTPRRLICQPDQPNLPRYLRGRAGSPRPATGTRGFVIREERVAFIVGAGPRADLPGCRQFARPRCVTHRPIRRLPGWLAAMSRESPQALPRALAAPGYGDGFWPDGVWRS